MLESLVLIGGDTDKIEAQINNNSYTLDFRS